MPLYDKQPHMSEVLTTAVFHRNKLRDMRTEVISRPLEEWFGTTMSDGVEDLEGDMDAEKEEFELRPCFLGQFCVKISNTTAKLSRTCELILASRVYTVMRLIVAPIAFFNLAYLAPQVDLTPNNSLDITVYYLDLIVNAIFSAQAIFQICGTPIRFQFDMYRRYNTTDSEIIGQSGVLALPITVMCFYTGSDSYNGLWLRLARLIFIVNTIFDFIPQTHILLSGMFYGLKSTFFSFLLLFNLTCMYACLGYHLFRLNDPFNFGSYSLSLFSWFRVATFDAWSALYWQNLDGCDGVDADYTGSANNGAAIINTNFGDFYLPRCVSPSPQPAAAGILFWSYVILGAFVLLSVSLAAVAIGIMTRFDELQNSKFLAEATQDKKRRLSQIAQMITDGENEERIGKMKDLMKFLWTGYRKQRHVEVELEDGEEVGVFLAATATLREAVNVFAFRMLIVCVTLAGVTMQLLVDSDYGWIWDIKIAVQCVLSLDLLARLLLHTPHMGHFFTSAWRLSDMVTIVFLWLPLLSSNDDLKIVEFLYFFRLFLAITNFFYIEELASVTLAILESSLPFFYVSFVMFVFYYFFAISGVLLFKEADPYHWKDLSSAINTLLQLMTMDGWTGIARNAMLGCANFGYATGFPNYDGLCFQNGGDGRGQGWYVAFHYITVIMTTAYIVLSMLVGMILSSLELLRQEILEKNQALKKAEPVLVEHDFSAEEEEALVELFCMLDRSENGYLAFPDIFELLVLLQVPTEEHFPLFRQADKDNNGQVDFAEFVELIGAFKKVNPPGFLRAAKKRGDNAGDGDGDDGLKVCGEVERGTADDSLTADSVRRLGFDPTPVRLPDRMLESKWDKGDAGQTNFAEEELFFHVDEPSADTRTRKQLTHNKRTSI